jgi:hypothetical protein
LIFASALLAGARKFLAANPTALAILAMPSEARIAAMPVLGFLCGFAQLPFVLRTANPTACLSVQAKVIERRHGDKVFWPVVTLVAVDVVDVPAVRDWPVACLVNHPVHENHARRTARKVSSVRQAIIWNAIEELALMLEYAVALEG